MADTVFPVLRIGTILLCCAALAPPPQPHAAQAEPVAPKQPQAAQAEPVAPKQPQAAQAGASRFALALVNDPKGKAIVDIGVDDFVVQEGSVSREVLDVRVADYPVVVVVDNGTSARADFDDIKASVVRLIERLGPRPLAIVTTAAPPKLVATFDDERDALAKKVAAIEAPGTAAGEPLRAASLAARTLTATGTLFSTIVMATASPIEVSGAAADPLIAPIVDGRAVLHIVANDRMAATTAAVMRGLAQQTGGQYTAIFASPSYLPALERLAVRLTSEMLIEYLVPPGSHAVDPKIGVRIPGARVRGLGVAPR